MIVRLLGFTLYLHKTVLWQSRMFMGIDNPLLLTVQPNLCFGIGRGFPAYGFCKILIELAKVRHFDRGTAVCN